MKIPFFTYFLTASVSLTYAMSTSVPRQDGFYTKKVVDDRTSSQQQKEAEMTNKDPPSKVEFDKKKQIGNRSPLKETQRNINRSHKTPREQLQNVTKVTELNQNGQLSAGPSTVRSEKSQTERYINRTFKTLYDKLQNMTTVTKFNRNMQKGNGPSVDKKEKSQKPRSSETERDINRTHKTPYSNQQSVAITTESQQVHETSTPTNRRLSKAQNPKADDDLSAISRNLNRPQVRRNDQTTVQNGLRVEISTKRPVDIGASISTPKLGTNKSSKISRNLNRPQVRRTDQVPNGLREETNTTKSADDEASISTLKPGTEKSGKISRNLNRPQVSRKEEGTIQNGLREETNTTKSADIEASRTTLKPGTKKSSKADSGKVDATLIEKIRSKNRPLQDRHYKLRRFKKRRRNKSNRRITITVGPKGESSKGCQNKGDNDGKPREDSDPEIKENEIREIRKKMFIDLMAEKLRLTPRDLEISKRRGRGLIMPKEIIEQNMQDNAMEKKAEEFYAQDKKIVIPGTDLGKSCIAKRTSGCFKFELAGKIQGVVSTAKLYVYKMPDRKDYGKGSSIPQTFYLYGLERQRSGRVLASNRQIQRHTSYVQEGWVVINVTRAITAWIKERRQTEMIAIRCATCATRNYKALYGFKQGYKPLLIVEYDPNSFYNRDRRSSYDYDSCNPEYECCKRRLVINFLDLHLTSVVAPPVLSVGYCFGFCGDPMDNAFNHTMFKQRVRLVSNSTTPLLRHQLKPCCVPKLLKSTSIILRTDGVAKQSFLPHVIVDSCGCA